MFIIRKIGNHIVDKMLSGYTFNSMGGVSPPTEAKHHMTLRTPHVDTLGDEPAPHTFYSTRSSIKPLMGLHTVRSQSPSITHTHTNSAKQHLSHLVHPRSIVHFNALTRPDTWFFWSLGSIFPSWPHRQWLSGSMITLTDSPFSSSQADHLSLETTNNLFCRIKWCQSSTVAESVSENNLLHSFILFGLRQAWLWLPREL